MIDWLLCALCRRTTKHTDESGQMRCIECGHLHENGDDE